ncbi:WbqC family protein [Dyadobacter tibetensis]|uniref:WbqC family protein n=1 Tax=Dyadobacter tibetensis TaxID=1211851 RepID=UPI0004708982|nr:WbqC family protein [Dyadobacter tibetensis]
MRVIEKSTSEKESVRIELQYLPSLEYFCCLLKQDEIWLETEEVYQKQTYRNRCKVLTANKIDILTVPVKKYSHGTLSKDIEIDYDQNWKRRHWGCFQSAYGKSPYYEYYAPELRAIYDKEYQFLVDLNYELLTFCLRLVGLKKEVRYKMSGSEIASKPAKDFISTINNKKSTNNYKFYRSVPYYQTFGNDFVENLSIIDLLFNMGPESRGILISSSKAEELL